MWLLNIICHFKSQDFTCISATDLANPGRFSMHLEVMVHVVLLRALGNTCLSWYALGSACLPWCTLGSECVLWHNAMDLLRPQGAIVKNKLKKKKLLICR
ncbi:Metallothionein-like protein CRS5 [Frankliniella fusca]|uniref:Metallothionein-like protein CRS5 n=1 Tax=Frankliniella fusca TaxID=407009 RepID=A0AAE1H3L8_9NEOP|nr:Metallothionein-like protein CRS5 [Frankliniella fusca]